MKKIKIKPLQEGRDISERKRDEKRTLLINALLEGFVRKSSRKEFLDTVVDLLSGWTGCRYGGIRFEKRIAIQENEVPNPLKIVIYRVMQEALNNAVQHSGSGVVFPSLIKNGGFMELTIKDQGSGFDLESSRRGLGLTSMKERVELSSGVFAIETTKGKGTVVRATWPL